MDQSLSITLVLEGGLAQASLSVQDNYNSPAQVFNVPLEFVNFDALVSSTQSSGEHWIVTASPDNPRFQVESAILTRHHNGKIVWDLVYEHYEPFLNIDLGPEEDDFDENIISFIFDPFQYTSTLYQSCQTAQNITPTTFKPLEGSAPPENPVTKLPSHTPKLHILWQKHGIAQNLLENGQPTSTTDHFAHLAETQWLQDIIETLDDVHNENVMENLDAYLESLPEEVLARLETNGDQLQQALIERWEMLVNSLTEDEANSLENDNSAEKFPNSLKLRLMREFLEGNPSVLLGDLRGQRPTGEKVVDLQSWKSRSTKKTEP